MSEFTTEQIVEAITTAISEHKFDVAISLTRLLAVQDPVAAQSIIDTVTLATAGSR